MSGAGFLLSGELQCRFGDVLLVDASYVSATVLRCLAPAGRPGSVALAVTLNGGAGYSTYSTSEPALYTYKATASLLSAFPAAGDMRGGQRISLRGVDFVAESTTCRFGSNADSPLVEVVVTSTDEGYVEAPAHATGVVKLLVSINGQDFSVRER